MAKKIITKRLHDLKVGEIVYLERYAEDKGPDGKPLGNYDAGERVVLGVGLTTIEVAKMGTAYETHSASTRNLIGADRWNATRIGTASDVAKVVGEWLDRVDAEVAEALSGAGKKQWVDHVYHNARNITARLRERIEIPGKPVVQTKIVYELPHNLRTGRHFIVNGEIRSLPANATVMFTA